MNSIELVESLVAKGLGLGVSVLIPGRPQPAGIRALPLAGFPSIRIGMIWRRDPGPLTVALMKAMEAEAKAMRLVHARQKVLE